MVFRGVLTKLGLLYREFDDPVGIGWAVSCYYLVSAVGAAVCGRFGDLYGSNRGDPMSGRKSRYCSGVGHEQRVGDRADDHFLPALDHLLHLHADDPDAIAHFLQDQRIWRIRLKIIKLAIAENGCLLNAPDVYMDKIAVGPGYSPNIVNLDKTVAENVNAVAKEKGVAPGELIVCVLDRPRHEKLIAELRALGCGVMLIPDGDVAGVIATTNPDTTVDIYMGSGGAPEGVLAAAALRCVGGQFKGRLLFRNDDERSRARKWGIEDLDKIYDLEELAKGDCIFAATGVTDGSLLAGVKTLRDGRVTTETVVMRASSGTVRWVKSEHRKAGQLG
mgnify:CR=1 FL=1